MTINLSMHVERVLPSQGDFTDAETDAILEVAYLTTAADGRLSDEENESFRAIAARMRGMASGTPVEVSDPSLDALFERYAMRSDHADIGARLKDLRGALQRPVARDLAYKVAYAMSLCDLETGDAEDELDDLLVAALDLDDESADALAGEVYEALDDGEDDDDDDDGDLDDEDEDDEDDDESAKVEEPS